MHQFLRYCQHLLLTTPLVFAICLTVSGQNLGDGPPLTRRGDSGDRITTIRSGPDRLWQLTGPYGGDVTVLVIDPRNPDRVLTGTSDGQLYQSLDGGKFWQHLQPGPGIAGQTVTAILFDRQERRRLFVSLKAITALSENDRGGGLFVSDDDGLSWRAVAGLQDKPIRGVAQSASDPRVLAVAALDGVYRTRDSGARWEKISPPGRSEMRGFHSVAIDPRAAEIIYVGTSHLPWKTLDGGRNWQLAGSAATGMLDDSDIFSIQIEENTPNTILISACSGIYRSFDASATWTKFKGIPTESRRTQIIYRHPTRPEVIFAGTTEGLWLSKFYGMAESWRRVTSEHLLINSVAIHPARPDRVFIGTEDGGVLISQDGGETWQPSNDGFINRQVGAVLADRLERGRIYAGILFDGESSGLFISADGGLTWKQSLNGLGRRDVYSLHQSPALTNTIYAGTNQGIFRSDDQGETWREVRRIPPAAPPVEVKPRPKVRQSRQPVRRPTAIRATAIRATAIQKTQPAVAPARPADPARVDLRSQVFSINSFNPRADQPPSPASRREWLIASAWDGLYLTENEELGWRRLKLKKEAYEREPHIKAVATSHQTAGLILVGTEEGLYISEDTGRTFSHRRLGEEHFAVRSLTFDPRTSRTIYAGTTGGFFRSFDGGQTWEQRGGGMPLHTRASAIRINELYPDELFLADEIRSCIYHSTDRGENWVRLDLSHLPSALFRTIAGDPFDPRRLYLGSLSGGVYVLRRLPDEGQ
ncbi:MAG: hypothetical protein ACK496_06760 [Acidobacteriota bacterium]